MFTFRKPKHRGSKVNTAAPLVDSKMTAAEREADLEARLSAARIERQARFDAEGLPRYVYTEAVSVESAL